MFFLDLGVLPNLISGAERERERWRKRVSQMPRKERGGQDGKDESREDEK